MPDLTDDKNFSYQCFLSRYKHSFEFSDRPISRLYTVNPRCFLASNLEMLTIETVIEHEDSPIIDKRLKTLSLCTRHLPKLRRVELELDCMRYYNPLLQGYEWLDLRDKEMVNGVNKLSVYVGEASTC